MDNRTPMQVAVTAYRLRVAVVAPKPVRLEDCLEAAILAYEQQQDRLVLQAAAQLALEH